MYDCLQVIDIDHICHLFLLIPLKLDPIYLTIHHMETSLGNLLNFLFCSLLQACPFTDKLMYALSFGFDQLWISVITSWVHVLLGSADVHYVSTINHLVGVVKIGVGGKRE